jgi:hypothetical protein
MTSSRASAAPTMRVAVGERAHRVEEVRHGPDATMDADDAAADELAGDSGERSAQLVLARGDERRMKRRRARRGEPFADEAVAVGVGAGEVDAREAVHLQVDQSRDREPVPSCGEAHPRDPAVDDLDVPRDVGAVDDRCLDIEPHGATARAT